MYHDTSMYTILPPQHVKKQGKISPQIKSMVKYVTMYNIYNSIFIQFTFLFYSSSPTDLACTLLKTSKAFFLGYYCIKRNLYTCLHEQQRRQGILTAATHHQSAVYCRSLSFGIPLSWRICHGLHLTSINLASVDIK